MYRMSLFSLITLLVLALYAGSALAHCGTCGVGEPAVHGEMDGHDHSASAAAEETAALPESHVMTMPLECPGGCGMAGGLCGGCLPVAEGMLRGMAVDFCPDCDEPDALCEMCETGVNGALDLLIGGMTPSVAMAPAHTIAYLAGTLGGDVEGLWGNLMGTVMEQNLFTPETQVGGVVPFGLSTEGFNTATTYYAGVSVGPDMEVAEPLALYEVPAGVYMVVDYYGPYQNLGSAWLASFAYAQLTGIELGQGPCGEHYVSDPETTPEDELLTQIFISVAGHTDDRDDMPADEAHTGHAG